MFATAVYIVLFTCGAGIGYVQAYSDADRCTAKGGVSDSAVFDNHHCVATKDDVNLACPSGKTVVLSSIQFAVKMNIDVCTKRVLTSEQLFCCRVRTTDTVYDGDCLQDVWSPEDLEHYREFMREAAEKCKNSSPCVLNADMFKKLQTEIPTKRIYSSYIQIIYQCISAPSNPVEICSSESVTGKEFHLLNSKITDANRTCTCHVTSSNSAGISVKAVDVRTKNSGLVIKSDNTVKDLSRHQLTLLGLKQILSGNNVYISVNQQVHTGDNVWLYISGSNEQDVKVVCGVSGKVDVARISKPDITHTLKSTTEQPKDLENELSSTEEESSLEGYWPVIYLCAGSGITLVLFVCISGSVLICRYSMKKTKRGYDNPYNHSKGNFNRSGQYDTVPGGMPNIPESMMTSTQDPYEWPHAFVK